MTCIVGLETKGAVYLGADSFVGSSGYADKAAGSKLFERNGWHVGVSGATRVAGLLEHVFDWPAAPHQTDDAAAVRLANEIGKMIGGDDMCTTSENGQRSLAMELLVVGGGRLYSIGSSLGVHRSRYGYLAAGSGEQWATGALAATSYLPPRDRVLVALKAAARHSPTVAGPFRVVRVRA